MSLCPGELARRVRHRRPGCRRRGRQYRVGPPTVDHPRRHGQRARRRAADGAQDNSGAWIGHEFQEIYWIRSNYQTYELVFSWWQYEEAGTYPGHVFIEHAAAAKAKVHIPTGADGQQIHIILEVRDRSPIASLRDYRRVVVDVQKQIIELDHHFNQTRGRGDRSYQKGEKITIKVNLNADEKPGPWQNCGYPTPHLVYAMVRGLIEHVGVPGNCITLNDSSRPIKDMLVSRLHADPRPDFHQVLVADRAGGSEPWRVKSEPDMDRRVSEPGGTGNLRRWLAARRGPAGHGA